MSAPKKPRAGKKVGSPRGKKSPRKAAPAEPAPKSAPHGIQLLPNVFTPLANADGSPRRNVQPYLPVVNACSLCPARCCRLNVKVSLADAIHYCTTLSLPFFSGLTFVQGAHPAHAFLLDHDDRLVGPDERWLGRAEIQLRRREDGSCHALTTIGGYERCGAYEARPSLCRLYPMSWTSEVARGGPEAVLCPVPYGITPDEEGRFVRDIERSIDGWRTHDEVVKEWNEADVGLRTARAFLEFALPRAAARTGSGVRQAERAASQRRAEADSRSEAQASWPGVILADGWPEERLYREMVASKVLKPMRPPIAPQGPRPAAGLTSRAPRSPETRD